MVFKIGSFNALVSVGVLVTCMAGIGAVPYGVKWLWTGKRPVFEDAFERYIPFYHAFWLPGSALANTWQVRMKANQSNKRWLEAHKEIGNIPAEPTKLK